MDDGNADARDMQRRHARSQTWPVGRITGDDHRRRKAGYDPLDTGFERRVGLTGRHDRALRRQMRHGSGGQAILLKPCRYRFAMLPRSIIGPACRAGRR
ncbi:hypothetical protein ABNQ38_30235 [Azospirillum sp. A29]|jgi:hypothetical protein|uniref:hypothetical protein n=1 Tax=Azospirillum sp. A29 TaxID=3160606 RepID=UPI00366C6E4F